MTLIQRLEAGPGSRKLSDECLLAVGWTPAERPVIDPSGRDWGSRANAPDPSQNLQDALDWLRPEGWFTEGTFELASHPDMDGWHWHLMDGEFQVGVLGHAATPALALCAASLRAREAMKEQVGG